MALMRLIILIVFLLAWVAVVLQNQAPVIALVFLGLRSPFLPLGIWIGVAVLAGMFVGLVLWGILALPPSPPFSSNRRSSFFNRAASRRPQSQSDPHPRSAPSSSDWDDPPASNWQNGSDWGPSGSGSRRRSAADFFDDGDLEDDFYEEDPADFSDREDPEDASYSFSYRDPKFAAQDSQKESVFDAEYRVLTPPHKTNPDRWDTLEDEEFE